MEILGELKELGDLNESNKLDIEQMDLNSIKLPYILKDKILMAPGIWNENIYPSEEIINSFSNTNWEDTEVTQVFADHSDRNILSCVGKIINPRLSGDKIIGDVALWNKDAVINVVLGKMRCGISPKIKGKEDKTTKSMSNISYINFSLVTDPACKKAYINLSQNNIQSPIENKPSIVGLSNDTLLNERRLKMEEEKIVTNVNVEQTLAKDAKTDVKINELNDSSIVELISSMDNVELSLWSNFVDKKRTEKQGVSYKELAREYLVKKERTKFLCSLSEDELLNQIKELSDILRGKKGSLPHEEKEKQLEQEVNSLRDKVKELEAKLNEPDKKNIKALSSNIAISKVLNKPANEMFLDYLKGLK